MPSFRTAEVVAIAEERPGLQRLQIALDGAQRSCLLYTRFAHPARPGDRVVVNTTATDLGLGSGGHDFVVWNLAHDGYDAPSGGHIMKLRYTPAQTDVLACEAPESPHHQTLVEAEGLDGMPVVAISLHSQLVPICAALQTARVAYVMTDGAALEATMSDALLGLKHHGWLCGAVTCGHAVGGDLEAVNVYSALQAAHSVLRADVAIVGMGPGVVGTATPLGTTALELGTTINAAAVLGGRPVACVRMSSGDPRDRHAGVSHHMDAALGVVAMAPADLPVPSGRAAALPDFARGHRVIEVDTSGVSGLLVRARELGLPLSHMGRTPSDDPLFFEAAAAAGLHAAALLAG